MKSINNIRGLLYINKIIIAVFIFSFNMIPHIQAASHESPKELLLSLPEEIGDFKADDIDVYDYAELGASRVYKAYEKTSDIALVTIYLYNAGYDNIQDGVGSKAIIESKNESMRNINTYATQGRYLDLNIISDEVKEIDTDNGTPLEVIYVSYTYIPDYMRKSGDAAIVDSDLMLVGLRNYICKLRITRGKDVSSKVETQITRLVQTLLSELSNTPGPGEIKMHINEKEWRIAFQAEDDFQKVVEYVRKGQSIKNWGEMVTLQSFFNLEKDITADNWMDEALKRLRSIAINFQSNIIRRDPKDSIYEWCISGTHNIDSQYEIDRVIVGENGVYILHYATKDLSVSLETRKQWLRIIKSSIIKH